MFRSGFSSIVMPAYRKPKEKPAATKVHHNPNDSINELSTQNTCEFCEDGNCQDSCASEISNETPMKDTEKIVMRSVESVDSKLSKSSGKAKPKPTKAAPPAKKKPATTTGGGSKHSNGGGGPLCAVPIGNWSLCEVLLGAVVLVLLIVVVREACKIVCHRRRRRRRRSSC